MWQLLLGWLIFCMVALGIWHLCCVREFDFTNCWSFVRRHGCWNGRKTRRKTGPNWRQHQNLHQWALEGGGKLPNGRMPSSSSGSSIESVKKNVHFAGDAKGTIHIGQQSNGDGKEKEKEDQADLEMGFGGRRHYQRNSRSRDIPRKGILCWSRKQHYQHKRQKHGKMRMNEENFQQQNRPEKPGWRRPFPPQRPHNEQQQFEEDFSSSGSSTSASASAPPPSSSTAADRQQRFGHIHLFPQTRPNFPRGNEEESTSSTSADGDGPNLSESQRLIYIRLFAKNDKQQQIALEHPLFTTIEEAPPRTPVIWLDECSTLKKDDTGKFNFNHFLDTNVFVQPGTSTEGIILGHRVRNVYNLYSEFEPDDYEKAFESRPMDKWKKPTLPHEAFEKMPSDFINNMTDCPKNEICPICLEPFEYEQLVTQSNCEYFFHKICILQWLKQRLNCPICRMTVDPEQWNSEGKNFN